MPLRRRTRLILIAALTIVAVSPFSPLFWWLAHIYYEPAKRDAMQFCESLVPQIEATWQQNTAYPDTPDPAWLSGREIPKLIRPKHFYTSHGVWYSFYFWNPGDFGDDFWSFDSRDHSWSNFDANKPRD